MSLDRWVDKEDEWIYAVELCTCILSHKEDLSQPSEVDDARACYTGWSESERDKQIRVSTHTYETYSQGRNGDADVGNGLRAQWGGREWERGGSGVSMLTLSGARQLVRSCRPAQGGRPGAAGRCGGLGRGPGRREGAGRGTRWRLLGAAVWRKAASQVALVVKSPRPVQERKRQFGSLGREAPRGRHGNPLRYSHLENPADREAWRTPVHTVTESARLKRLSRRDGRSQHSFVSTFLMFNLKNRRETELESQMFKKIKSLSLPRAQEG